MNKYFLSSTVGALALLWQINVTAAPFVRYEAHSYQGKKSLISMQKALAKLKSLGCTKTVSWYYQGAIHGVPVPGLDADLVTNPLCPSFTTSSGIKSSWAKCASHTESGPPSETHFLPWHQLYIAQFEKIIRKFSGDPKFALPYWDYNKYPTLPGIFQARAKGSLYEVARNPRLNKGLPIADGTLSLIRDDLKAIQEIADFSTYTNQLQKGVHDMMHDYIGGTDVSYNKVYNQNVVAGLMGNVPSAAFDPIFWLHHSNIDRLWYQWVANNPGQNVTLSQLNATTWPYKFVKLNGELIDYTMPQVFAMINKPDYVYDTQTAAVKVGKSEPRPLVEHRVESVPLDALISGADSANIALNFTTEKLLVVGADSSERVVLKLNVAYSGRPNNQHYKVYVNLPDHVKTNSVAAKEYFVGMITFFVNDPTGKGGERDFRYDITNELAVSKQSLQNMHLTVVKASDAVEGAVTVKNAELLYLQ